VDPLFVVFVKAAVAANAALHMKRGHMWRSSWQRKFAAVAVVAERVAERVAESNCTGTGTAVVPVGVVADTIVVDAVNVEPESAVVEASWQRRCPLLLQTRSRSLSLSIPSKHRLPNNTPDFAAAAAVPISPLVAALAGVVHTLAVGDSCCYRLSVAVVTPLLSTSTINPTPPM